MSDVDLGDAIRTARGDLTQEQLASRMTALDREDPVTQSKVSRWEDGRTEPAPSMLARLERAAGRPRGYLLRLSGFVPDPVDVLSAIEADPRLDEEDRRTLARIYRALAQVDVHSGSDGSK